MDALQTRACFTPSYGSERHATDNTHHIYIVELLSAIIADATLFYDSPDRAAEWGIPAMHLSLDSWVLFRSVQNFLTYRRLDLIAKFSALGGGVFALRQWIVDQRWRRYQQLDGYIATFERDDTLRLATQLLDWNHRTVPFVRHPRTILITSENVISALAIHTDPDVGFTEEQAVMRDALDALLAFFGRLESAIANQFVDERPAIEYFGYWLRKMYTMEEHVKLDRDAPMKMRAYEEASGPTTLSRLYRRFSLYRNRVI